MSEHHTLNIGANGQAAGLGDEQVAQASPRPTAWRDVQFERQRQIDGEGWTPEHDDQHSNGEMARAAAAYAYVAGVSDGNRGYLSKHPDAIDCSWPRSWDRQWWKPTTRRRDLVKAAALILAEIERIDRAASKSEAR